jgi:hypothetical protein
MFWQIRQYGLGQALQEFAIREGHQALDYTSFGGRHIQSSHRRAIAHLLILPPAQSQPAHSFMFIRVTFSFAAFFPTPFEL